MKNKRGPSHSPNTCREAAPKTRQPCRQQTLFTNATASTWPGDACCKYIVREGEKQPRIGHLTAPPPYQQTASLRGETWPARCPRAGLNLPPHLSRRRARENLPHRGGHPHKNPVTTPWRENTVAQYKIKDNTTFDKLKCVITAQMGKSKGNTTPTPIYKAD